MLRFPATQSQIDQVLEELEMVSRYDGLVHVCNIKCPQVENLGQHIGDICLDDPEGIERLNRLDHALQLLTEKERYTFSGALENEKVEGLDTALALIAKLDQYLFVPNIKSERELGQFLANTGYPHPRGCPEDRSYGIRKRTECACAEWHVDHSSR